MRTILVAEHDRPMARLIQVNLERQGYHVLLAGTADQVDGRVVEADLLIIDAQLPPFADYRAFWQVRQNPAARGIPIVLLVPPGREVDVASGLGAGCDAVLARPFDPMELVRLVRELPGRGPGAGATPMFGNL